MPAKDSTDKFFPALGIQHVITATNLGTTVIIATLGANTNYTNAQLIASPPNTGVGVQAAGPVVHSLGVAPAFAFAQPMSQSIGPVSYVYVTADNSAVYFKVYTDTAGATGVPVGVASRIIVVQ